MAHCEALCEAWAIPLIVERVTLADEGLGIEAQARKARYTAFAGVLLPGEALVTAQHLDDQCETFCWRLSVAADPRGFPPCRRVLILPERNYYGRCLARPARRWKLAGTSAELDRR